jgi:hypothetical protein
MEHQRPMEFVWLEDDSELTVDQLIEDLVHLMVSKVQDEWDKGMCLDVGAMELTWRTNK